ncbi:MAG: rhomboid family intramembrane serine protease [Crocinitomicaceae bacterium]|jgi:membrane associated rhomboid family serine protease
MRTQTHFESHLRNAIPPALFVMIIMWLVYWSDYLFVYDFHKLGVMPKTSDGLKGIFFMPWIHSHGDIRHLLNNSIPTFLLLTLLFYSYREIALRVFLFSWFVTGILLWVFANNNGAYHIGMSGVIYSLAAFLFTSGVLRKYLPLQALSLFIVFIYGSMIWGIFPTEQHVSWEGHLSGMLVGIFLAFYYRKLGPQRPKYQYEIEKELGIEPPDLEGQYWEQIRLAEEQQKLKEELEKSIRINYEIKKSENN